MTLRFFRCSDPSRSFRRGQVFIVLWLLSATALGNDTKRNIAACRAALTEAPQVAADTADLIVKRIKGGVLQRIEFVVKQGADRSKVTCRVRRGEVRSTEWDPAKPANP